MTADPGRALHEALAGMAAGMPGLPPPAALMRALARRPQAVAARLEAYGHALRQAWAPLLGEAPPTATATPADARFADPDWERLAYFRLLRDVYLVNEHLVLDLVELAALPPRRQARLRLQARQWLEAWCPANFPAANPQVLREAHASGGRSLERGLAALRADLDRGHMPLSDTTAFRVGHDVAATPGAVVLETPVCQLLQYRCPGPRVHERALLVVPPFVNRYYVLDLQAQDSFVRHALDQGLQVFMISWRNPQAGSVRGLEDYLRDGVLAALALVRELTAGRRPGLLGYCAGGTLAAMACALLPAAAAPSSLTLLATLLDYRDAGGIGSFVDAASVAGWERRLAADGVVGGTELARAFASLRPRELVWQAAAGRYLLGRPAPASDLLYWNDDVMDVPATLFLQVLRLLYLENRLARGTLEVGNRRLDLGRLRMPAYVVAAENDHIIPWQGAYASARHLAGTIDFVLASAGHVAGIICPPGTPRRHYRAAPPARRDAAAWARGTACTPGSWWDHWGNWVRARSGRSVAAPAAPGSTRRPPLEPAPGRYVLQHTGAVGRSNG